jgi:hypothetical protein
MLIAALAFNASATGAIYKWVDERGVTHYSEKPPQGKKPAEVPIRSQPAPATTQAPPSTSKTWQEQEADFQRRRVEQEESRMKKEALDQASAAERRQTCMQARHDLHILEQERPVFSVNEKGERVYIEDKDRGELRDRLRQIADKTCDRR